MAILLDGFKTTLTLFTDSLSFEIEVTPPAIDGGEPIPQDHMRSGFLSVFFPRKRQKLGPLTLLVAWDSFNYYQVTQNIAPGSINSPVATVNKNQFMSIVFSDGSVLGFWGAVTKFEPGAMKDGERPTATIIVMPTLMNCSGVVMTPTFTAGSASYC